MKRRSVLAALGVIGLAGCAAPGVDRPLGSSPTPTATPTPTAFEVELEGRLESDEADVNMDVVHVDVDDGTGVLEYRAGAPTQEVIAREMATVAATYAVLVADGHEVVRLEVTVRNIAGTAIATYHIESEWVRELQRGEITTDEYLRRVLESFEAER